MCVLIVDDAVTARMMLTAFLRDIGYTAIYTADDGINALKLLPDLPVLDMVLVDWNMPYMNGLELVKEIRRRPQWDQTKILMVTTETGMEKMVEALENGANEYIMKPFTREMLLEKMAIIGVSAPL